MRLPALFYFCQSFLFSAVLSAAYFSFSAKPLSMFNLLLPVGGFPITFLQIFFRRPSCLRKCPSRLCFQHQVVSKILLVSFTICTVSTFITLSFQLTGSILLQIHIQRPQASFCYLVTMSKTLLHIRLCSIG